MIVIKTPHTTTRMEIFNPRYKNKWAKDGEMEVLMHIRRVDFAQSSVIIVEFPKAKWLQETRHAIYKKQVQPCPKGSNQKDSTINMYIVPMSMFDTWISETEENAQINETIKGMFNDQQLHFF